MQNLILHQPRRTEKAVADWPLPSDYTRWDLTSALAHLHEDSLALAVVFELETRAGYEKFSFGIDEMVQLTFEVAHLARIILAESDANEGRRCTSSDCDRRLTTHFERARLRCDACVADDSDRARGEW